MQQPPSPQFPLAGKKWEILRLAGVRFFVQPGFLLFMAIFFALLLESSADMIFAGLVCFIAFFSLMVHEAGHALAARAFGLGPVRVTLVMFGGHTQHPPTTRGRALLITLAGPLGNLLICAALLAALATRAQLGALQPDSGLLHHALALLSDTSYSIADGGARIMRYACWLNLLWLAFNMLPIMPLDGGQVMFHLLSFPLRVERALAISAAISVVVAGGIGTLALVNNWGFIVVVLMALSVVNNYQILRALRHGG